MKIFTYRVRKNNKNIVIKQIFEKNSDFFHYISLNNIHPISYKISNKKIKIKTKKIIKFTDFFISLLESKINVVTALDIIISEEKTIFGSILNNIKKDIMAGETLYNSFSKYREVFPENYLQLISAGEKSENLIKNLKKGIDNLKIIEGFKKKAMESLYYPLLLLSFIIILIIIIFLYVLPNFKNFFIDSEIEIPTITKYCLMISDNLFKILTFFFGIFILIFIKIKYFTKNKKRYFRFKIPFIKNIFIDFILINIYQNFSILLESDLPIDVVFDTIKKNLHYPFLKREMEKIEVKIINGSSIYESFSCSKFFTKEDLKFIKIGEESDSLAVYFDKLSMLTQKKLKKQLLLISIYIQPVFLIFLGIIIGFILFAIYLPILNMGNLNSLSI